MSDKHDFNDRAEHMMITAFPSRLTVLGYLALMVMWATLPWASMTSNPSFRWGTIGYAPGSIFWAFLFWTMTTNWRGWGKRLWGKPGWGNRHPREYVRPQSQFIQAAAWIITPIVVLSDLLVIGLALLR